MNIQTMEIIRKADKLVRDVGSRNPRKIARDLGIEILPMDFKKQRGAYKVIMKNRFIYVNKHLNPIMENIVIWHEIGHDILHRDEAIKVGGFKEFNIFDMRENRMEYEANIFAAQLSLSDDEIIEYIMQGYDTQQIARAMNSDINLVALKADALILQGHKFRPQEHNNRFLR